MKRILVILALLSCVTAAWGQAKKPTIMVVPSENWCIQNKFFTNFDNQGTMQKVPDYKAAMQGSSEMRLLITKMAGIMAQRDFPLKSLEGELRNLETESMETSLLMGSETGSGIAESPIERLNRTAQADIILDLSYEVKKNGARQQVVFNLMALDAYTNKIISGNTGTSSPSAAVPVETLLEESVLSFMDGFAADLQRHFDDMFANGREIKVIMRRFDACPINFETEFDYNGQYAEFADILDLWFYENCV